jgi:hypothetical protein
MKAIFKIISISTILYACQLFVPKPESEKFYCKIDGKAYRPTRKGSYSLSYLEITSGLNTKNNFFYISTARTTRNENSEWVSMSLKFENLNDFKLKKYLMNNEFKGQFTGRLNKFDVKKIEEKFTSLNSSGFIEFTKIDTVGKKISGVFEFKAKSTYSDKVIKITNGQFNDLSYFQN